MSRVVVAKSEIWQFSYHKLKINPVLIEKPWIFCLLCTFSFFFNFMNRKNSLIIFLLTKLRRKISPSRHQWKYGKYVSLQWKINFTVKIRKIIIRILFHYYFLIFHLEVYDKNSYDRVRIIKIWVRNPFHLTVFILLSQCISNAKIWKHLSNSPHLVRL
jgi:hypothetical protein